MSRSWQGLRPAREVLDNGVVVIAKAIHDVPAVTISAAFKAGLLYEPPGQPGVAYLLGRLLDRGAAGRDAGEIADALDSRGVSLGLEVGRQLLWLTCTCLTEDFAAILRLLGDLATAPALPPVAIEMRRSQAITSIRQDDDNPAVMAGEALSAALYPGDHPYGRRPMGSVESMAGLDRAALAAFHLARFAPGTASVAVVGDVETARAFDEVARVFGAWRHDAGPTPPAPAVVPAASRREIRHPLPGKAQADIAYGFTAVARSDAAYHEVWLMNHVLGDYGLGGRVGDRIREREGMAYYAFSTFEPHVLPGPIVIRAGVNPANVRRAVAAIDAEVDRMAADGVTAQELDDSRRYLIGSIPRTFETGAGIAQFLQNVEYFGLGLDYDVKLPGLLAGVTREAVNEAARRILSSDRATLAVAGPEDDGHPALEDEDRA